MVTFLELLGFACIVAACFLLSIPAGLLAAGTALVMIAQFIEQRRKPRKANE